jgi:hypothetical protein
MVWFVIATPGKPGESTSSVKGKIDERCLGAGAKKLGMINELKVRLLIHSSTSQNSRLEHLST